MAGYEGIDDGVQVVDEGYHYTGAIAEFTVPLVENNGVLLRRRTDQGIGGQAAHVFADDIYAGIWYEPDQNFGSTTKRWLDSEFMLSSNLVAGKSSVRITIVPLPTASTWNEFRYWVNCIRPFELIEDSDVDQLPDNWEIDMTAGLGTLDGETDTDGDGFTDLAEFIAGTHPTNPASYLTIGSNCTFESSLGRLYQIQESTNLASNVWITVRSDVPGTGADMVMPVNKTNPSAFHRLQVELP